MHSRVVTVPAVPLHMNNTSKANNISSRQLEKLEIIIKIEFNLCYYYWLVLMLHSDGLLC